MSKIPTLFTEHEVAERLRRSIDTIRRERDRKRIGYTEIGKRIFYTEDQVIEYLHSQRVEPCRENAQTESGKSGTIGSRNVQTVHTGAAQGLSLDRQSAHRLAQLTFGKPKTC
ncbi:helix-turn-helix domain-containing protein [Magnetovibrio sp. PR-2]|uniref:helix-turn-helix domain-containing protein n=1 Tax=Magnetovibrio sp. PR-2 TaxID=3120356 RepID=UPI003FA5495C